MTDLPAQPLSLATKALASIMTTIEHADEGEIPYDVEVARVLAAEFADALENVVAGVDRRKALYAELSAKITLAEAYMEKVERLISRLHQARDKLEERTKALLLEHPDIQFRDSFGASLKLQRNSQPTLKLDDSLTPAVDALPAEFVRTMQVFDKRAIKNALQEGAYIPWAELEYGQHVRGLK